MKRKSRTTVKHLLLMVTVAIVSGCTTVGYYSQSISGHLSLLARARPISQVVADTSVPEKIRRKLQRSIVMREFASQQLALPDNNSYKKYADLQRPFAIWNVFAAPELSLQSRKWCFLVVGCVSYRGYYSQQDAETFASGLRATGDDVYVGGVPAYSTLGWFDDPLVNTVMGFDDVDLAGLIFHELAHQVVYVKDDSKFNESFATAVELEGVRRWLRTTGSDAGSYQIRKARRQQIVDLILDYRERLEQVYSAAQNDSWKRQRKVHLLQELRERFQAMSVGWEGMGGFRRWFSGELNNAKMLSIATYYDYVPAFLKLIEQQQGDLSRFYAAAKTIGALPASERARQLEQLAALP